MPAILYSLSYTGTTMHHYTPPVHTELLIHFVDESMIIVDKAAGLLSVPGRGDDKQDCLLARLQLNYPDAMVVHRLDMATSGLMVLARNPDAQRQLSLLFAERRIEKRYIALVDGLIETTQGEINAPLTTDWPNRPRQKIDHIEGKPSLTYYRVLEYTENCTRVELRPVTGRTHQLRLHMQSIGHPIIGDTLYASPSQQHSPRLQLHACYLEFAHPDDGRSLIFKSSPEF